MGTLERIAHALEEQTKLQRHALIRLGWLVEEPVEQTDDDAERSSMDGE